MSERLHVRVEGREAVFGAALGEIRIGRGRGCAIRFMNDHVAEHHASLRHADGAWTLEASGDNQLLFIEGQPIFSAVIDGPLQLRLGDAIHGPVVELLPQAGQLADATAQFDSPDSGGTQRAGAPASFSLDADVVRIGRAPESDIVVNDVLVSRRHAEIHRRAEDQFEVVDLRSHNGTFVNGRRVEQAVLEDLDVIEIGRNSYRLIDNRLEESVDSGEVAYAAVDLTRKLADGTTVLDRIAFSLESRSMLAVVGPSGAGKSTLLGALTGFRMADEGDVRYGDRSLYREYEALRPRVGYVPQDDIVHRELTVGRALGFAADLRFPPDTAQGERQQRVSEVIEELSLGHRVDTKVASLSGGERKRVNVALELLTAPSLLFLDEPTSGLDPNYSRSLMEVLRELADRGRTVVVATHDVQNLRLFDRVLVLAPGGQMAYFGPPQLLMAYFDKADVTEVFRDLSRRDESDWGENFRAHAYHAAYIERPTRPLAESPPDPPARNAMRGRWHQFTTLTRRYFAVVASDRRSLALLLSQAPLLGLLLWVALPGGQLKPAPAGQLQLVSQASLVLLTIVLAVSWLGMSNAVQELVREIPLFRRERSTGVALSAYLGSKVCVLGVITVIQAVVVVLLATLAQHGPPQAVLLGWPVGELMVIAALTGLASMAIGLLISAIAKTTNQAAATLPLVLVLLLVLALGGVFPQIGQKPVLKQLGYVAPTRWGFAGLASTSDLNDLQAVTGVLTHNTSVNVDDPNSLFQSFKRHYSGDPLWDHTPRAWLEDAAALLALTLLALMAAWLALRRDSAG